MCNDAEVNNLFKNPGYYDCETVFYNILDVRDLRIKDVLNNDSIIDILMDCYKDMQKHSLNAMFHLHFRLDNCKVVEMYELDDGREIVESPYSNNAIHSIEYDYIKAEFERWKEVIMSNFSDSTEHYDILLSSLCRNGVIYLSQNSPKSDGHTSKIRMYRVFNGFLIGNNVFFNDIIYRKHNILLFYKLKCGYNFITVKQDISNYEMLKDIFNFNSLSFDDKLESIQDKIVEYNFKISSNLIRPLVFYKDDKFIWFKDNRWKEF